MGGKEVKGGKAKMLNDATFFPIIIYITYFKLHFISKIEFKGGNVCTIIFNFWHVAIILAKKIFNLNSELSLSRIPYNLGNNASFWKW